MSPAVSWGYRTGSAKIRRYTQIPGLGGSNEISGPNSNITNLLRGVAERVFFVKDTGGNFTTPPKPHGLAFNARMYEFFCQLSVGIVSTTPWTREEFLSQCPSRKRAIYTRAVESLRHKRIVRKDAHMKTFIKWEKHSITSKPDFVPRVIQPRDPRYNVEIGRYLSKVEKSMMETVDLVFGHPTIMSGYNASEVAAHFCEAWDQFSNPVAVSMDASRFDQHVSVVALKWEHSCWLEFFTGEDRKELDRLLKWQLVNVGRGRTPDGWIKYKTKGKRMSGDMNTSSGNKLLMCAMLYSYMRARKIRKYRVLNNGDDSVVILERSQLKQLTQGLEHWFLTMGFNMKVEAPAYRLEEIEFCQSRPIFDGKTWTMMRNYPLALDKDSHCFINNVNGKTTRTWMRGVGLAGSALCGGLPIAQEFYAAYVRNSIGYKARQLDPYTGLAWLSRNMDRKYSEVSDDARYSFYSAFGILPDLQIAAENTFKGWTMYMSDREKLRDSSRLIGFGSKLSVCACPQLGPKLS